MSVSLTATQCPLPVVPGTAVYMGEQYSPSGSPPTSLPQTSGNTAALASSILNRNATGQDMASVYGAGGYGIGSGLALSVGSSLTPTLGKGQALCHGVVENTATAYGFVVNATATNFVWIKQDGSLVVQNGTTAKPSGNCLYLGACLANASAVTAIDTSGVVYYKGGQLWRETADTGVPGDSPDSSLRLFTKTQGGTYYWDGTVHRLVAGTLVRQGTYANRTSVVEGDEYLTTDAEFAFRRDSGGNLDAYFKARQVLPPVLNGWGTASLTAVNQGSATISEYGGCLVLGWPYNVTGATQFRLWKKTQPSTPYRVVFGVEQPPHYNDGSNGGCGIFFSDGTKLLSMYFSDGRIKAERWNSATSFNATQLSGTFNGIGGPLWMALAHDGTTTGFQLSADGFNWTTVYREADGTFLTASQNGFGFLGGRSGTGLVGETFKLFSVETGASVAW